MRRSIKYALLTGCVIAFASCNDKYETYNDPEHRINFLYETTASETVVHREARFTFAYSPAEIIKDTVWVEVETMGFLTDRNRKIVFKQILSGENDAVAGKHYLAFDNTELMNKYYFIEAGKTTRKVPIIILRDETMKAREFTLLFTFEDTDDFKVGYPDYAEMTIKASDILTRPKNWEFLASYYFAGDYGYEKHKFMVDVGVPAGLVPNDDMFDMFGTYDVDMGLAGYYYSFFANKLVEENQRRASLGLGKLAEANGTIVRFRLNGTNQEL